MEANTGGSTLENINDGFFEIEFKADGVFLTVYPPELNGKKVETTAVIDRINRKRVRNFKRDIVEFAVLKADRAAVKIADALEEEKINATAKLSISPDKMKAYLTLFPPEEGRMLTPSELLDILARGGVVFGINKTVLDTVCTYPIFSEMICVAEGTQPINGCNGKVEYYFDISRDRKPTVLDDGRVDYRELNLIESVHIDQKLCSLIPPVKGIPGKNILGTVIPGIDGKSAVLPKGRNIEISPDGQSLISKIDGQVSCIDGKVSVFSNYEVPADVDNSTGNISFVGNVCVRGNVLSGFIVEAGGNVEVWGVVEGAVIKAGGDIILRRGMQGLGKGTLISGGDIITRYIENSNIEAKNNIKAEAIMHSNVKCGNKLELVGKKGLLVGGTCKVGREVAAKVIGSHMATFTDVEVGVDPSLRERYKNMQEEISTMETDIKKADQAIVILKKLEVAGGLTPEKQEMIAKSIRTKLFFANRINMMKEEMSDIELKLQQEVSGKIRCFNFIYPGTKVTIGKCAMMVKETLQYCTLYRDGADIRTGPVDKT